MEKLYETQKSFNIKTLDNFNPYDLNSNLDFIKNKEILDNLDNISLKKNIINNNDVKLYNLHL